MTATLEKPRRGRSKSSSNGEAQAEPKLVLPVQFGDVTIGDGVAGLGATIVREKLQLSVADEYLCCKRLVGMAVIVPGVDDLDQTYLNNTGKIKHRVRGAFDVRSFRVTPKQLSTRLSFSIESIDVEELSHFAKKNGFLVVELIQAIPDEKKSKDAKGQKSIDEEADISEMDLNESTLKKLRDAGAITMGKARGLLTAGTLADVVGKGSAGVVENEIYKFFQNAPGDNGKDEDEEGDEDE